MGRPETSCPVVCMKRSIYDEFSYDEFSSSFLERVIPTNTIPADDSMCTVVAYKDKVHGDGTICVRDLKHGIRVLIRETGEVYTNLTEEQWKSYNSSDVFLPGVQPKFTVEQNLARRFIVAMFGPEELSERAVREMCSPLSKCPRKAKDALPCGGSSK